MIKRSRAFGATFAAGLTALLVGATAALAYSEHFSGNAGPNNGYIQNTTGAHTFDHLHGDTGPIVPLACQLFNNQGTNVVTHGRKVARSTTTFFRPSRM